MRKEILTIAAASALLFGCSSNNRSGENSSNKLSGTINIDGSSTVYPLSEAVAEEFRRDNSDIRVTIGSSGSGAGFKKFARGESDISDASRAIKDKERKACAKAGIGFIELRVALDGIAIVVNKDNTWAETLTTEQLKQLWEPHSEIDRWSQMNAGWPDEKITLFGPSTAHGTYDFFTKEIVGKSGSSRSDFNAVSDYNVAVQGISSDKNALGYFGLAYYTENKDRLKLLSVDNGSGPVFPSLSTVGDGSYAPLARPLFIYVNKESAERPEVMKFLKFYIAHAASLSKEVGYIPLKQNEYDSASAQIDGEL